MTKHFNIGQLITSYSCMTGQTGLPRDFGTAAQVPAPTPTPSPSPTPTPSPTPQVIYVPVPVPGPPTKEKGDKLDGPPEPLGKPDKAAGGK